ncbi:GNAT family N-acetyltransferase [Cutibacterium avidum]|uniref:GNAT family N-acetyltransferase n=1 Tax=Cutibacterium avidum TaxID=33010 RepID=UPI00192ACC6A|nr:GNAT family N-acetyltransferase [Cutibacterium avidum]QQY14590.1 GNAT family N-acetyltransferase [Cutibacterium avidum]
MDTSVNVDTSSRSAHDPATAPGRFVVRDAHREDLPEAAAVQAVCFREIGQGVIPNDILTEVTGPGIVHTTIEQWKQFMDDGAVFKILVDRLDMRTVGVAMARISTSPDAPTPWEVATLHVLPEARNCGASDDLLNACIGHRSAYVWVFADNARAITFYERQGFHVDDTDGAVDDSLGGVELQRLIRGDVIEAE